MITEEHFRIGNKPILQIGFEYPPNLPATVTITNYGLGPALNCRIQHSFGGKIYDRVSDPYGANLRDAIGAYLGKGGLKGKIHVSTAIFDGSGQSAGSKRQVFSISRADGSSLSNDEYDVVVDLITKSLVVRVTYEDLFGQQYVEPEGSTISVATQ